MGKRNSTGERYPSGKLKPKNPTEALSVVIWQRMRQNAKLLNLDPLLTSELHRLNHAGELTNVQTVAGHRIGSIYGRYEAAKGLPRSIRSPSYELGRGGDSSIAEELMGPEQVALMEGRIRDAMDAWNDLQELLKSRFPRNVRDAVETVCVEDRCILPVMYENLRCALTVMAVGWGITTVSRRSLGGSGGGTAAMARHRPLHFNQHEQPDAPVASAYAPAPRPTGVDKLAFTAALRKAAPGIDDQAVAEAFDYQQAYRAREIFRRSKEASGGQPSNVVKLADLKKS